MLNSPIIIGRFGKPFGVRGWINLQSFTHPSTNILHLVPWKLYKNRAWLEITPEASQIHNKNIVVQLPNCCDRDTASTYTNCEIVVERSQLPSLDDGEYYWSDLEGFKVINKENVELGVVDYLFAMPANDVLVVKEIDTEKKQQRLIPFTKYVVLQVDLKDKIILVDWDSNF